MSSLASLKAEVIALRAQARASGRSLKHCTALEQVAKRHGSKTWRSCLANISRTAITGRPLPRETEVAEIAMKHYRSQEWDFSLDIPKRWNKFPPVSSNSPNEGIRFVSHEGAHYCIAFRLPRDPGA
jgi:Glyoxalase superfamily protein